MIPAQLWHTLMLGEGANSCGVPGKGQKKYISFLSINFFWSRSNPPLLGPQKNVYASCPETECKEVTHINFSVEVKEGVPKWAILGH